MIFLGRFRFFSFVFFFFCWRLLVLTLLSFLWFIKFGLREFGWLRVLLHWIYCTCRLIFRIHHCHKPASFGILLAFLFSNKLANSCGDPTTHLALGCATNAYMRA